MERWKDVAFGELAGSERAAFAMGPFGSKITKENYTSDGVPVVRGVNLARGIFVDSEFVFISANKADELASATVGPGDLIFTHRGTIGQVSMIPRQPKHPRYVIGSSQVKCRLDTSRALPEYYYYWFQSPQGQHSILSHTSTVGVPGIATPLSTIRGLRVPFPPLHEQQAIAEVLGALDDKIAVNERIANTSVQLGEGLLELAVQSQSYESSVGSIAEIIYGKALPEPKRRHGDAPVYGCTGQVGWHDTPLTDFPVPVVGRKGANAGHVSWMSRPGWVIDTAYYARPLASEISTEALYFVLNSAGLKKLIGDSAVPGLNRDLALRQPVRLPAPEFMVEFRKHARYLLQTSVHKEAEVRSLTTLRDTLIPQLVTGKLRIKDAERAVEDAV